MLHKIVEMKDGWYIKVPYYFSKLDMHRSRFDPLSIIGIAAMAGGTALSAYSTIQAGEEAEEAGERAAKAGELQQQQFEAEALAKRMAGLEAGGLKRKEGWRLQASQIATISGLGLGFVGSNLVIMAESARNIEWDALTIGRSADIEARSLTMRGEWAKYEGQMAGYEGQMAKKRARIRALTGVLGTAGQAFLLYGSSKLGSQGKTKLSAENKATLAKY